MTSKQTPITELLAALPPRQTFTVPTIDHIYSYIHIQPAAPKTHTLLFLHGFPSHIEDWIHQIAHFSRLGYGVLVPDLLGFGQSSSFTDVAEYRYKTLSADLIALLEHAGLRQVIGVGHDFGSQLLGRFVAFHPERFAGVVFLAVGSAKMGSRFDLHAINQMTKQQMGFEMLGYQVWLADLESGADKVLEKNAESAMSLMFAADSGSVWPKDFHPIGAMELFVKSGRKVPIGEWYPRELQEAHLKAFGGNGGYRGGQRWYANLAGELGLGDENGFEDWVFERPVLFIGDDSEHGKMCEGWLKEWAKDVRTKLVKTGHWVQLERKEIVNEEIEAFAKSIGG